MFIGITEVYIKKSHYLTFTGIILYQVNGFKVKWGAKLAIISSSHNLWNLLIKYLYLKLLYPTELWHANGNRNYHISGYYLLSCKRLYESMWLVTSYGYKVIFFLNFCFIASCLKCIRFQFSGKLKRFSVKTSSFIVGCRNCTEEMCHHLFVLYI